jgi:hypothetical protein
VTGLKVEGIKMTDNAIDTNNLDADETSVADNANVSAQAAPSSASEKMVSQSDLNAVVGHMKGMIKDLKNDIQTGLNARQTEAQEQQPAYENVQQPQAFTEDQVRQMVSQEAERMAMQRGAERVANEFTQKLMTAKDNYEDFEEVVSGLNLPNNPQIVAWANGLDNTADVIYEIGKHPTKFANLLTLANTSPNLAVKELQRLSESIKTNQEAAKSDGVQEPLSQIKPSTTGTDNGSMTVKDLKNQPWLRG